jgi:hypothetical protein
VASMNKLNADANVVYFMRFLKKLGLLSSKTYIRIGQHLLIHGGSKKDTWRKTNWKEFLKDG